MSFPVDRRIADVGFLPPLAFKVQEMLRWHLWKRGTLPTDNALLAALVQVGVGEFEQAWPLVKSMFVLSADGTYLSAPDLDAERKRALIVRDQKRDGARIANENRAKKAAQKAAKRGRPTRKSVTNGVHAQVHPGDTEVDNSLSLNRKSDS